MEKPNFFVIGAPKCGTTALCEYLRFHPQVFVCEPKEPHYFAVDFSCFQIVEDEPAYLNLFRDAGPEHIEQGEGSVFYLYSIGALKKIREFQPDARIIIMLRNPVEMLPSYHAQMLYSVHEDVDDFEAAWDLQEARREGKSIPKRCIEPKLLQYENFGMFGKHVAQVRTIFPSQNIKIVFFEDFVRDTRSCYLDVLEFLGVDDDGRIDFPAVNERKEHKSKILGYLYNNRNLIAKTSWATKILRKLGFNTTDIKDYFKGLNARKMEKKPLSGEFRQRLARTFHDDIQLLEKITSRNLDHWLK